MRRFDVLSARMIHTSRVLLISARLLVVVGGLLWASAALGQEKKRWSLNVLYGPEGKVNFEGSYARELTWLPDGLAYLEPAAEGPRRCRAETGECTPQYDAAALQAGLEAEGLPRDAARALARSPTLFTPDHRVALFVHEERLLVGDLETGQVRPVAQLPGGPELLSVAPDGETVALVAEHELWSAPLAGGEPLRLTHDGGPTRLNGKLDWVYQEEVYGRGNYRAFWWSEDGARLAFLQLDISQEPITWLVDHLERRAEPQQLHYPKAGEPNAVVRLGVVPATGGPITWVDTGEPADAERLIVRAGFAPDGRVIYQVQDRTQRWLKLNEADPRSGASRTLLTETSPAWVEADGVAHWLKSGEFVWKSARDGWDHLYLYAGDGRLVRRLTEGPWEVRRLHGVDEACGWVYFSGTQDSAIEEHVYRVRLSGGPSTRLSTPGHQHRALFDPHFRYFIDTYSSLTSPPQVRLCRADGEVIRTISENRPAALDEYEFGPAEFVRVPNRDGFELNAVLIRPPRFDPDRAGGYPVLCVVYGGPRSALVQNRWDNRTYLAAQWLAQEGVLTWILDPRASCGGTAGAWRVAGRFGADELADLEDGLEYLKRLPYVDARRIGLMGHSFGGFLTLYALLHSQSFCLGVAAAPVTDWRLYDSIYTERYLGLPEENAAGYEASSIVAAAAKLRAPLLLVHGTLDDNVHVDHTLVLCERLQALGKPFELMLYPRAGHSLHRNARHYHELRWEFVLRGLLGRPRMPDAGRKAG